MHHVLVCLLVSLVGLISLVTAPAGAQETALPSPYLGSWEGTATQINPTIEWPLTIELTGGRDGLVVGTIDYPSLACGGELTLASDPSDGASVELSERLTYGESVCADGGLVVLTAMPDGSLEYRWSHPMVNSPAAGMLHQASASPPAPTEISSVDHAPPPRAAVTFDIEAGVSAADETLVREGIRLAQDYFAVEFGVDVRGPVIVEVLATDPGTGVLAMAGANGIIINTAHQGWISTTPLKRVKIVVHEYFHLLQRSLTRSDRANEAGPLWLTEGSAELVAFRAVASKGLVNLDDVRTYHLVNVVRGTPLPPLTAIEGRSPGPLYSLTSLAVEGLVADHGGLASLTEYYDQIGDGASWESAFAATFGQSAEAFSNVFETTRLGFVPPALMPVHLREAPPPIDGAFEVTIASATNPIAPGEQAVLTAWTAPGAVCRLSVTDATEELLLDQPTTADSAGNVFWLWSTDRDVAPGPASVVVSCGGTPSSLSLERAG